MTFTGHEPQVLFAVQDRLLQDEIQKGIFGHLPATALNMCFGADPATGFMDLIVVGVSALPQDTSIAWLRQRGEFPRCGVIVKMEERAKWAELAAIHAERPFKFVVAVGGPREKITQMFPGTRTIVDISDLAIPGKLVADFIWSAAQESASAPKFHRKRRIS